MPRHLRHDADLTAPEFNRVLDVAVAVKKNPKAFSDRLSGKSVAIIFSKQSTRTRISFEVGCYQLGAQPLILNTAGSSGMQMGRGESVQDTARVLSRYVNAIVIRTFGQDEVDGLAEHGSVPVVNALTDAYHPCQILADALTLREKFGKTKGLKVVYAGAANNVSNSLMLASARGGFDVVVACPESLAPDPAVLAHAQRDAAAAGTRVTVEHDLLSAARGAHALYTDTWVSMGQEKEAEALKKQLHGYDVTARVMAQAAPEAIFMHCLPAHRGEEVAAEVIDGPQSVVFDEAENRLHAQKALMLLLLGGERWAQVA